MGRIQLSNGQGSGRLERIKSAIDRGDQAAPVDLRYLERAKHVRSESKLFHGIFSFLEQIYNSVAESLPDVRDRTYDSEVDPYAVFAEDQQHDVADCSKKVKMRPKEPKTKMRKNKGGVAVNPARTVQAGFEVRWLPPGSIKDYWIQYNQQVASSPASFPTFWRVPCA